MIFPECYTFELRREEGSYREEFIVSISGTSSASFYTTGFGKNVLYVGDKSASYYFDRTALLASGIAHFLSQNDVKRALFIGLSKAGFGALLLSQLCAKLARHIEFGALAFSPQVLLYPRSNALSFPSYGALLAAGEKNKELKTGLQRFGLLAPFDAENLSARVYYGENNVEDSEEIKLLAGKCVTKIGLPISGHLTHIPFVVDTSDSTALRELIDLAYSKSAKIGELRSSDLADRDFREMSQLPRYPTVVELTDEFFEEMKRRSAKKALLAAG